MMAMRNKYGAVKTTLDGYTFDSKREAARYGELKLLEKAGEIQNLTVHPSYQIVPGYYIGEEWIRPVHYEADFQYEEDGELIAEDVKGVQTALFKLKAKLFRKECPHIELRIVR